MAKERGFKVKDIDWYFSGLDEDYFYEIAGRRIPKNIVKLVLRDFKSFLEHTTND